MKGINFREPLFRAIVEGRKTQTRRKIPKKQLGYFGQKSLADLKTEGGRYKAGETVYLKEPYWFEKDISLVFFKWKKSGLTKSDSVIV